MKSTSYLRTMALTGLTMAILTVAFTVAIDPYRRFGAPTVAGWNEMKPRLYNQAAMAKTYQLERIAPRTLLLGNSRIEAGLDPESPLWPAEARPVFNAAEAGTDLFSSVTMLRNAAAVHAPDTVIIGLDIVDFIRPPKRTVAAGPSAPERRIRVTAAGKPNPDRSMQELKDVFASTLTIDALLDSVITLAAQRPETTATMTPYGFNPLKDSIPHLRRSGYHAHFAEKTHAYENQFKNFVPQDFSRPETIRNFAALGAILDLAAQHDMRAVLFIHPYHAQFLDVMDRAGFTDDFTAWKQAMTRFVTARRVDGLDVALYDFSAPNDITTEAVPPKGDVTTTMRWYWESGHYKASLGDLIIARATGADAAFGIDLTDGAPSAEIADSPPVPVLTPTAGQDAQR